MLSSAYSYTAALARFSIALQGCPPDAHLHHIIEEEHAKSLKEHSRSCHVRHSHLYLDTALVTRLVLVEGWEEVGDVVPGVAVEASAQSLLVEEMGNQTNGATEHEQTVEHTHLEVVLGLFLRESATVSEQVDEADGDAAVDVEDQVVLLTRRDGLDGDGVV